MRKLCFLVLTWAWLEIVSLSVNGSSTAQWNTSGLWTISKQPVFSSLQNIPEVPTIQDSPATDLARSLATIHQICVTHREDLITLSQVKVRCLHLPRKCSQNKTGSRRELRLSATVAPLASSPTSRRWWRWLTCWQTTRSTTWVTHDRKVKVELAIRRRWRVVRQAQVEQRERVHPRAARPQGHRRRRSRRGRVQRVRRRQGVLSVGQAAALGQAVEYTELYFQHPIPSSFLVRPQTVVTPLLSTVSIIWPSSTNRLAGKSADSWHPAGHHQCCWTLIGKRLGAKTDNCWGVECSVLSEPTS